MPDWILCWPGPERGFLVISQGPRRARPPGLSLTRGGARWPLLPPTGPALCPHPGQERAHSNGDSHW